MKRPSIRSVSGGVTAPRGFRAAGLHAGIKKKRKPDMALIVSDTPCAAAGALTTNQVVAAPVTISRTTLQKGRAWGILGNSGSANCCTGPAGHRAALAVRQAAARQLGIPAGQLLIASTGAIGKPLPVPRMKRAIPTLIRRLSRTGSAAAARGILTTDLITKSAAVRFKTGGRTITIGGIAKGSGMIDPAMATMLCFITTDAPVGATDLKRAVREQVQKTFNQITVDGQMSTNDTVFLLANGAAGGPQLAPGRPGWQPFCEGLRQAMERLARLIAEDGEGATALVTIEVAGTSSNRAAQQIAKQVANAPLVKTMVAGRDPNWGRVAATVGASPVRFNPRRLEIRLGGIPVYRNGGPVRVSKGTLKRRFSGKTPSIQIRVGSGSGRGRALTCDLTHGYIRINAKYN